MQDNGSDVETGEPFVEVEAMKMIMPIKATESGKITHNLSPGSVINAGDLLASLELKDPSKVKKIIPFEGDFDIEFTPHSFASKESLMNILGGYNFDAEATVAAAFQDTEDIESAADLVTEVIDEFVRVESMFDSKLKDDVVRQMTKDNAENLDEVIALNLAHQNIKRRKDTVLAVIRQVESFSSRFGQGSVPESVYESLGKLSGFTDKRVYGEITLAAENLIRESKVPGFEIRVQDLRNQLLDDSVDLDRLSKSATLSAGVDLLTSLFNDEDANVRTRATETYIRRVYRAHRILDISVDEVDGKIQCKWSFRFADVPESDSVVRYGFLQVVDSESLSDQLPTVLSTFGSGLPESDGSVPANVLHIVSDDGQKVEDVESALETNQKELNMLGIRTVNLLLPVETKDPLYYSFPQCDGFKESPLRRNMRPTFHHLLELSRLDDNFDLERLSSVQRNAQVYVGTEKNSKAGRGGPPQVVFVRGISHAPGLDSVSGARRALIYSRS